MIKVNINILSVYLKKWSFDEGRFTLNYAFSANDSYNRCCRVFRISKTERLIDELIQQVKDDSVLALAKKVKGPFELEILQTDQMHLLLKTYFENIIKEFRDKKNASGKSRMKLSRSMDLYYKASEYATLSNQVKFYVHLNRGMNKINGELWGQAVTDLLHAHKFNPKDAKLNKYLAMAYNELGKFSRAILPMQIYATAENTSESLNALAAAYINMDNYEKAEKVYEDIAQKFDEAQLTNYGRAVIAYKQGKKYISFLDKIKKADALWLTKKLKNDWDYSLCNLETHTDWNTAAAARYLGFNRPFDLTCKAINHEVPCYYDQDKGTVRFIREELDCWVQLHNRYNLDGRKHDVFVDRLLPEEKKRSKRLVPAEG